MTRDRFKHCLICKTEKVSRNHFIGLNCLKALPAKQRSELLALQSHGSRQRLITKIARSARVN